MSVSSNKTVPAILITLIVILAITSGLLLKANYTKKTNLKSELTRSEQLLSEKLTIEAELDKTKAAVVDLQTKQADKEAELAEIQGKLYERERRIKVLSGVNTELLKSRIEAAELRKAKADLEKEQADLKLSYKASEKEIETYKSTIGAMEAQKTILNARLEKALTYNTDNFLINATKWLKKEKLTTRAVRAKKLTVTFDIPTKLTDKVSFKLVSPSGNIVSSDDNSITLISKDNLNSREIEFTYTPLGKMEKGIYKIEIQYKGNVIGNSRIQFR
ncbi:MAG: hypothetical protein A2X18_01280 [Bacteroidetes bacterium GWF2_40_14]|nr:MAG: hypothetical protein A2X18_01280 [Bacteroidetes bacterium GWF2_40_14]